MKNALIFSFSALVLAAAGPAFAQEFDPGYGPPPAQVQLTTSAFGDQLMPHGSCRYGSPTGQVIGTDVCFDGRGAPRAGIFMQPDGTGVATGQQYGQPMPQYRPTSMNGYPPNMQQGYGGQVVRRPQGQYGNSGEFSWGDVAENVTSAVIIGGLYCLGSKDC